MKNNEKRVYKHKFKSKIPALTVVASVFATLGLAFGAGFVGYSIAPSVIADPSNVALLSVYRTIGSVVGGLLGLIGGVVVNVPLVQKVLNYSNKAGWKKTVKSQEINCEDNKEISNEIKKEQQKRKNNDRYIEYVIKEYIKSKDKEDTKKDKHTLKQSEEQER